MAARTVKLGFVVYTDTQGRPLTGYLGDDVDVHKDDLERFDRLNKVPDLAKVAATEPALTQSDIEDAVKTVTEEKDAELKSLQDQLKKAQDDLAKANAAKSQSAPASKPQS